MDRYAAMEAFIRVIGTGSFSRASKQLGLGQPAVSKMIAQLEARVGARLLLRSTHKVAPTEAGWKFYERAKRSVDEADAAESAARCVAETLTGRLRVHATMAFAQVNVLPHLPQFLAQHPALEVDIILDDRSIDLIESGIDLALRSGRPKNSTLVARKLAQCKRIVVGTPSYFSAAGVPESPADLAAHQFITYQAPLGGTAWTFRQGLAKAYVNVRGRIRLNTALGIRECVLADLGPTIASEWMFAPELVTKAVTPILTDWSLPPVEAWAIFPAGRRASAKARAFAAFIERQMVSGGTQTAWGGANATPEARLITA
jgi:DNA-binding transcriptional LysR family regulator